MLLLFFFLLNNYNNITYLFYIYKINFNVFYFKKITYINIYKNYKLFYFPLINIKNLIIFDLFFNKNPKILLNFFKNTIGFFLININTFFLKSFSNKFKILIWLEREFSENTNLFLENQNDTRNLLLPYQLKSFYSFNNITKFNNKQTYLKKIIFSNNYIYNFEL